MAQQLRSLALELQAIVSCYVDAANQTESFAREAGALHHRTTEPSFKPSKTVVASCKGRI